MGVVLTDQGRPVCMEVAPGDRSDTQALLPMVHQAQRRFGLARVCWVADGGMVSASVIQELERLRLPTSWAPGCGPSRRFGTWC